jgi:hypothetical protein
VVFFVCFFFFFLAIWIFSFEKDLFSSFPISSLGHWIFWEFSFLSFLYILFINLLSDV